MIQWELWEIGFCTDFWHFKDKPDNQLTEKIMCWLTDKEINLVSALILNRFNLI